MLHKDYSLKSLNTFGFDVKAKNYISLTSLSEISEVKNYLSDTRLILGGGSNMLFTKDYYDGTIIHPLFEGIEIYEDNSNDVVLKVGAGVIWDNFVEFVVNSGLGGVENLSLIPGRVGASPVQNVGAYGVESKDTITMVDGVFLDNLSHFRMKNDECNFSYRNSIFKNELKDKIIVTHVYFRLTKKPEFILNYGNVEEELKKYSEVNLKTIREAIISIRTSKLPDTENLGNAGSFFKNPIIPSESFNKLQNAFSNVPSYPVKGSTDIKVPAGWLIDQCGLKGYRKGNVGIYDKQALVLVNYGGAKPQEIVDLAQYIMDTVQSKFEVTIEPEVNYI